MTQQIIVVAQVKAKPGTIAALLAAQTELVHATRAEEGCIRYDLHVSTKDPEQVVFIETWESEEALQRHLDGPAIAAFRQAGGHLIADLKMETYRQVA